jgi:phenylalanyl-tRNA synthetase beta chain
MRARLFFLGQRAVSNVVDITNWVMLELGHPLHAFDLGRIVAVGKQKRVIVRRAQAGEHLQTLDGTDRALSEEDLVVADPERALALAGIMGGGSSEITPSTSDVLLETAYFEPQVVYRTAKRLNLHTEASHRFWRGADIDAVTLASERAAFLLAEYAGGKVCRGSIDMYPRRRQPVEVSVRAKRVSAYLGLDVSAEDVAEHLTKLELTLKSRTDQALTFGIPSFRVDLTQEVDLIEEVAREIGYHLIPETLPSAAGAYQSQPVSAPDYYHLREQLTGFGLSEAVNYAFISPKAELLFRPAMLESAVVLKNPMAETESVMRTSMLPGLVGNVHHNTSHQVNDVRLFELGRVFWPRRSFEGLDARDAMLPEERELLGIVLSGPASPFGWGMSDRQVDFFDLKRVVEWLLANRGLHPTYVADGVPVYFHPGASARVICDGQQVGVLGEIHPRVLTALGVERPVFATELSLEPFAQAASPQIYRALPRFPGVRRDVAMIVPEAMALGPLLDVLRAGGVLLEDVRLFDVYQGKPIQKGSVSVALALFFRHAERTLTDDEVHSEMAALMATIKKDFPIEVREG